MNTTLKEKVREKVKSIILSSSYDSMAMMMNQVADLIADLILSEVLSSLPGEEEIPRLLPGDSAEECIAKGMDGMKAVGFNTARLKIITLIEGMKNN